MKRVLLLSLVLLASAALGQASAETVRGEVSLFYMTPGTKHYAQYGYAVIKTDDGTYKFVSFTRVPTEATPDPMSEGAWNRLVGLLGDVTPHRVKIAILGLEHAGHGGSKFLEGGIWTRVSVRP